MKTSSGIADLMAIVKPVPDGLAPLVAKAGQADYVLIGEASHGTREFYEIRADLTRHLIRDRGFTVIALEADWPDTLRLHHYTSGEPGDYEVRQALGSFERFPRWMWRNETMLRFADWLREWNRPLADRRVGIFGMDLYSLHASINAVLKHLLERDPAAAARARERYVCFDIFDRDPQNYGYRTTRRGEEGCEDEVVAQLVEMRKRYAAGDDSEFFATQNAKVVADAEQYYRAMFRGRDDSWNLRDGHMEDTVRALARHYHDGQRDAKVVVWAHNSHLGDARATEMGGPPRRVELGPAPARARRTAGLFHRLLHLRGHRDRRARLGWGGGDDAGAAWHGWQLRGVVPFPGHGVLLDRPCGAGGRC